MILRLLLNALGSPKERAKELSFTRTDNRRRQRNAVYLLLLLLLLHTPEQPATAEQQQAAPVCLTLNHHRSTAREPSRAKETVRKLNGLELAHSSQSLRILCAEQTYARARFFGRKETLHFTFLHCIKWCSISHIRMGSPLQPQQ